MTASTIALAELAEKGADIDVLRQMVQFMALNDLSGETVCWTRGSTVAGRPIKTTTTDPYRCALAYGS